MGELANPNAMRQMAAWLGGGIFVAALAFCAWWYLVTLGLSLPFQGWPPVSFDVALFTFFALHHSVLARERVKASLRRLVPDTLSRTVYVWTASLLLIAVCALWRAVGADWYNARGWALWAHTVVQLSGVWLIARATAVIDPLELAGIRHPAEGRLQITGPYRWVRHPLYLGWVLAVSGHAHMTGDRALFAVITTTYLVVAVPFEERSLVASFGDDYRRYQREVRWRMVPYVF
jgi:protein-S-isoprenylcysteine O-methyltransferase Ste14